MKQRLQTDGGTSEGIWRDSNIEFSTFGFLISVLGGTVVGISVGFYRGPTWIMPGAIIGGLMGFGFQLVILHGAEGEDEEWIEADLSVPTMESELESIESNLQDVESIKKETQEIPSLRKDVEQLQSLRDDVEDIPSLRDDLEELKKQVEEQGSLESQLKYDDLQRLVLGVFASNPKKGYTARDILKTTPMRSETMLLAVLAKLEREGKIREIRDDIWTLNEKVELNKEKRAWRSLISSTHERLSKHWNQFFGEHPKREPVEEQSTERMVTSLGAASEEEEQGMASGSGESDSRPEEGGQ